jgi:hypothetical protein
MPKTLCVEAPTEVSLLNSALRWLHVENRITLRTKET